MPQYPLKRLTRRINGAAIEVHRTLGPGFLESVYEEALAVELGERDIPFERQKQIGVDYKGHTVGQSRLDLLVDDQVIVELKAVDNIAPIHRAQVLSYLKATELEVGLLLNFNVRLMKNGIHRVVLSKGAEKNSGANRRGAENAEELQEKNGKKL